MLPEMITANYPYVDMSQQTLRIDKNIIDKLTLCTSPTQTVRNKHGKLEGKGEASFDTTFMIKSHAKSMKKIVGALQDLPANQHGQSSPIHSIMAPTIFFILPAWLCIINGVSKLALPLPSNFSCLFLTVQVVCLVARHEYIF